MIINRVAALAIASIAGLLLLLLSTGCQSGPRFYHVSGLVTFGGKPLPAGQIFFDPDASKGNDGPQGFALIKDGKYDTAQAGRGVVGGPYLIRIDGFDGKAGNDLPLGRGLFNGFVEARDLPKEQSEQNVDVPSTAKR